MSRDSSQCHEELAYRIEFPYVPEISRNRLLLCLASVVFFLWQRPTIRQDFRPACRRRHSVVRDGCVLGVKPVEQTGHRTCGDVSGAWRSSVYIITS